MSSPNFRQRNMARVSVSSNLAKMKNCQLVWGLVCGSSAVPTILYVSTVFSGLINVLMGGEEKEREKARKKKRKRKSERGAAK